MRFSIQLLLNLWLRQHEIIGASEGVDVFVSVGFAVVLVVLLMIHDKVQLKDRQSQCCCPRNKLLGNINKQKLCSFSIDSPAPLFRNHNLDGR